VKFLYTECPSDLSGLMLTRMSKNGKVLSCSISIVNVLLYGYCSDASQITVVHPFCVAMNLYHLAGFLGSELMACYLKCSM